MKLSQSAFGNAPDGRTVTRFSLTNAEGHSVSLMNWGASLLEVMVPDRQGKRANVNLVFESLDGYLGSHPGFGSSIGRFCNRIAFGRFTIDGVEHQVTVNHGKHCLHGGNVNFSHKFWETDAVDEAEGIVRFRLVSPDGEEGFPGTCTVTAEYRFNDASELTILYSAASDAATHVNLTNHSYWNLGGVGSGSAMDHLAIIHGDQTLDVDADLIPTGKVNSVAGTPFDFLHEHPFSARINQLPATKGYDHCYVVAGTPGSLRPAAKVTDPASGRTLEIQTTLPGMQLYTANHLGGNAQTAGHRSHEAFCLETQHFPDAPNHSNFPSTLIRPGHPVQEATVHRFGVAGR